MDNKYVEESLLELFSNATLDIVDIIRTEKIG